MLWGAVILIVAAVIVEFVRQHPYWSALIAVLIVAATIAVLSAVSKDRARARAEQAERDRLIEVTDAMSGPEFEQWFARLLAHSGFTGVTVRGGPADRGADVTATAPDGRSVVVQCKRHAVGNRVGSAAIQRFAGTCRAVHGGDICMIVTNGFFTTGDGLRLAHELGIVLVDRRLLEVWAHTGAPPTTVVGR
ncbi:MAG TPA: restriction endonuclease [Micromonosporaceae bacterium]|nr:restriction endonuclease [Micromonosporaceae bacterium]